MDDLQTEISNVIWDYLLKKSTLLVLADEGIGVPDSSRRGSKAAGSATHPEVRPQLTSVTMRCLPPYRFALDCRSRLVGLIA
ncbi:hypothetical protein [Cupriavidus basilensis]|uniref:hypothetical protein n=1 Tax=Cupriavidus basilensis TaxID=68895 RepID=UPI0039F6C422